MIQNEVETVELIKAPMTRSRAKEIKDQAGRINVVVGKMMEEGFWSQGGYNEEGLKASKMYIVHTITQENQSLLEDSLKFTKYGERAIKTDAGYAIISTEYTKQNRESSIGQQSALDLC